MNNVQYSPQVVNSLAKASGLATQLRKVMSRVEIYQQNNTPIPVKLIKRAQVLIEKVDLWEHTSDDINNSHVCPMRFTPHLVSTPIDDTSSITKWGMEHTPTSSNTKNNSMSKKMKSKYKNQWNNMQKRQMKLYEST